MANTFENEQAHLSSIYSRLTKMHQDLANRLSANSKLGSQTKADADRDLTLNFDTDIKTQETLADIETINQEIDMVNHKHDIDTSRLTKVDKLLEQPYFAKVRLQFSAGEPTEDHYIGSVGISEDDSEPIILDWRSPLAETYYNQENGPTSYHANNQVITTNLKLRRQFDIVKDQLLAYFDTTVAIEDPLLRASLLKQKTTEMTAITATIQREQNTIVRYPDVPVILVNGIAGSGKTSVMLQRIAYLLYQQRASLVSEDIYLFTPNLTFQRYIKNVLPDLGEVNPISVTWQQFISQQTLSRKDVHTEDQTTRKDLETLQASIAQLVLQSTDLIDIKLANGAGISITEILALEQQYQMLPMGRKRLTRIQSELNEKLVQHLTQLAQDKAIQDTVLSLTDSQQEAYFGHLIDPQTDQQIHHLTVLYLRKRETAAFQFVNNFDWLNLDVIGQRLLKVDHVDNTTWLYLKMLLTGYGNAKAKLVMIDEVQDYTEVQLMILNQFFNRAHFMLLGDENQALTVGKVAFNNLNSIFANQGDDITICNLTTSYRSTPEITRLFTSLAAPNTAIKPASIQLSGDSPVIKVASNDTDYQQQLQQMAARLAQAPGLTAVIANTAEQEKNLTALLTALSPLIIEPDDPLPNQGLFIIRLDLAKGLEFENVLLPDDQPTQYPDTRLGCHRLYTAISRATHHVEILANQQLSPLLRQ